MRAGEAREPFVGQAGMTALDWVIIAVVVFSVLMAAAQGFIYEAFSLARSGAGIFACGLGILEGGELVRALR